MAREILPLRDYQTATLAEIERAWYVHGIRRPAAVLPTGAGKTVIFAHLAEQMHARHGKRTLILVHTDELVEQAVNKLHNVAPHMRVGVVKAARDEHMDAHAIVATVQTLRSERRREAIRDIGVIVVDECHHATAPTYRTILEHFGAFAPDERSGVEDLRGTLAVGFTATLARSDGAALGDIWQRVVYRREITDMIDLGHLLPARGKRVKVPDLDFRNVKKVHGDYAADEMGEALTDSLAPELVAKAYAEHASDRAGVLFAPTVESAYVFREALNSAGLVAEVVHGALPRDERRAVLRRFRDGDTQVVCNCMVLTEGFDEPRASCAVICRPTTSAALYTQMVGRVLRPYPGQADALVLDVVGVTGRHRLASLVDLVGDPTKRLGAPEEESLADLLLTADGVALWGEEEPAPGGGSLGPSFVSGDVIEVVEVDLFRRSHSAWLQTAGGTWFLPAGKHTVFLAPAGGDGTRNVAVVGPGTAEFRYRRVSLDAAMSWGEEVVRELGGNALVNRRGTWRRASNPPSEAQIRMAQSMRIDPTGLSKAELSDRISAVKCSRIVDPIVKRWQG